MPNKNSSVIVAPLSEQIKIFTEKQAVQEPVVRTKLMLVIAANTVDPTIGKGCIQDMSIVRDILTKVSQEMNFNFIELIIQGNDYGKENVLGAIDLLTPGYNDIVVFYYSGHGFSYQKDEGKIYPQVDLRPQPASDKIDFINAHTANLDDLFVLVKNRGARLNIVIGDCCNSIIDFKRKSIGDSSSIIAERKTPLVINKETCEALFCDYTASILVASASKGEYAVSDDDLGSIFTFNFSKSLKKLIQKERDTTIGLPWGPLLDETTNKTLELSKTYDIGGGVPGNQKAIYSIESRMSLY
ncbi:MAG: caspase family protein [Ferruginibacter sp.]